MALIPPLFLNTVVALGRQTQDGTVKYNATGFMYGYPTGSTDETGMTLYRLFLVTNRHVVQQPREHSDILYARFNKIRETGSNLYEISLEDASWTVHPDPTVDVAILSVNHKTLKADNIEYFFFQSDNHAFTHEQARTSETSEGDGVFVLGFPLGEAGEERNYVIVRQGMGIIYQFTKPPSAGVTV